MSVLVNTKYRSDEEEIMDDFDYQGEILHDSLDKLTKINRWLGGNAVTISGLREVLKNVSKVETLRIVDLGCGSGDILRQIAKYGKESGYKFNLLGIDANKNTINYAEKLSVEYDNLSFQQMDIFSEQFNGLEYDLVLSTLFFHHFKEKELVAFLKPVLAKAKYGVVVNDLHRHRIAYYLFKLLCLTIKNRTIIEDGLTSVLRGFKKQELKEISEKLNVKYELKWKWAFRFQWILAGSGFKV